MKDDSARKLILLPVLRLLLFVVERRLVTAWPHCLGVAVSTHVLILITQAIRGQSASQRAKLTSLLLAYAEGWLGAIWVHPCDGLQINFI